MGVKICEAHGCDKGILSTSTYCGRHKDRFDAGLSLDLNIKLVPGPGDGARNHRWNNGKQKYPNHRFLQKQRLIKLKSVNYKCEECDKPAVLTHHLDGTKTNHSLENLKALCVKCHISIYHKDDVGRKGTLVPGYTLRDLSEKMGCSSATVYNFIKKGKKSKKYQDKIDQVLKEIGYEV